MVDFTKLLNRELKTYEVPGLLIGVTGHRPNESGLFWGAFRTGGQIALIDPEHEREFI